MWRKTTIVCFRESSRFAKHPRILCHATMIYSLWVVNMSPTASTTNKHLSPHSIYDVQYTYIHYEKKYGKIYSGNEMKNEKICITLILVDLRPIIKNFFYINLCCKNIWCNLQRKKVGHNPQCYCNFLEPAFCIKCCRVWREKKRWLGNQLLNLYDFEIPS